MHRIPLFDILEIETQSTCNRTCPGCLRNSHPDRDGARAWFESHQLSSETVERLFCEAIALGFNGPVCLSHYNEPLQDPRIGDFAHTAKRLGLPFVYMCTNADLMTDRVAAELDGVLDRIYVALYMDEPIKTERQRRLEQRFTDTSLAFTGGGHIATHFSPLFDVGALARQHAGHPCSEPQRRMIVNHRGDMLFCCDDMLGHFELGNVHEQSLEDLWYSERHQMLVRALQEPGGRAVHPHCLSCPRA